MEYYIVVNISEIELLLSRWTNITSVNLSGRKTSYEHIIPFILSFQTCKNNILFMDMYKPHYFGEHIYVVQD